MTDASKWRNGLRISVGVCGFIVSMAAAFFVATYLSEGTVEHKTGSAGNQAQAVTINFPDGELTPTHAVPVTATVNNTSGESRVWKSFVMNIETPAVPTCGSQWLEIFPEKETGGIESSPWHQILTGTNSTPMAPIPTGVQNIFNPTGNGELKAVYLRFKPSLVGSTNQKTCENVSVKVTGKLTE